MIIYYFINSYFNRISPFYATKEKAEASRYAKFSWLMLDSEDVLE